MSIAQILLPPDLPGHRIATPADEPALLVLMREFYAEEHLAFDELIARPAVSDLLADPRLGQLMLLEVASHPIGYLALTFGFSLELHGRYALLDELYLAPSVRGRGWGRYCLELATSVARDHGTKALRLEVNHTNVHARGLYLRNGFRDDQRDLFTRWL